LPFAKEGRHKDQLRNGRSSKQSRRDRATPNYCKHDMSFHGTVDKYSHQYMKICSQGCQHPVAASCNAASCIFTDTYQGFRGIDFVYFGRYPLYARTDIGLYVSCVCLFEYLLSFFRVSAVSTLQPIGRYSRKLYDVMI
jgi:hypothetical protein